MEQDLSPLPPHTHTPLFFQPCHSSATILRPHTSVARVAFYILVRYWRNGGQPKLRMS